MSDHPWDAKIYNDGQMAEKCMSLGAVILKPASKQPAGFRLPEGSKPPQSSPFSQGGRTTHEMGEA